MATKASPQTVSTKDEVPELEPDAWERFETMTRQVMQPKVDKVVKAPPQHRPLGSAKPPDAGIRKGKPCAS